MKQKIKKQPTSSEIISSYRQNNKQKIMFERRIITQFALDVEKTVKYLQSIEYNPQTIQQIIMQIIEDPKDQHIGYLIKIITLADIKLKVALLNNLSAIFYIIKNSLQKPQGIMLLGNMCSLFDEVIQFAQQEGFSLLIAQKMHNLRLNYNYASMYSWTLCQLCRQNYFNKVQSIERIISLIYFSLIQCHYQHAHTANLIRAISYISKDYQIDKQLIKMLILKFAPEYGPQSMFIQNNIYIIVLNHLNLMDHESNLEYSLCLYKYLVKNYQNFPEKLKRQHNSLYKIITNLLKKSEYELASSILDEKYLYLLQYKYSNIDYLCFLQQLFSLAYFAEDKLKYIIYSTSLIQNIIHDINDFNIIIGHHCLRILYFLMDFIKGHGMIEQVEWMLKLGLKQNIEQIFEEAYKNNEIRQIGQKILQMISDQ